MKVSVCLLLLVCLARGQPNKKGGPPGPPPAEVSYSTQTKGGPSFLPEPTKPGATPAENPWHSLLHRMMQLIQEAAPTSFPPTASSKGSSGPTAPSATYTDVPAGSGVAEPNAIDTYPAPSQNNPSVTAKAAEPYKAVGPNTVDSKANLGPAPDIYAPVKPTPPPTPKPTTQKPTTQAPVVTQPPAPVVTDCFFEGKYYRPSSDIVRGQHHKWCYVTYCDDQGRVQFWDDYNCKPNSMKPTSTHNTGISGRSKTAPTPAPALPGCNYNSIYYELGQEIDTNQVGERCYGTYCNKKGQVIQWEDWCAPKTTPKPYRAPPAKKPRNQGPRNGGQGPRNGGQGPRNGGQGGQRNGGQGGGRGGGGRGGGGQGGGAGGRGGGQGGQNQGRQGGQGQGHGGPAKIPAKPRKPTQGCYHNNMYYKPNEDVVVGNIGDMCYGYYCEGDNTFVHWEDTCTPSAPDPNQPYY